MTWYSSMSINALCDWFNTGLNFYGFFPYMLFINCDILASVECRFSLCFMYQSLLNKVWSMKIHFNYSILVISLILNSKREAWRPNLGFACLDLKVVYSIPQVSVCCIQGVIRGIRGIASHSGHKETQFPLLTFLIAF